MDHPPAGLPATSLASRLVGFEGDGSSSSAMLPGNAHSEIHVANI